MKLLVTREELAKLQDLALECLVTDPFLRGSEFDERRWEQGLRLVLGKATVDTLRKKVEELRRYSPAGIVRFEVQAVDAKWVEPEHRLGED